MFCFENKNFFKTGRWLIFIFCSLFVLSLNISKAQTEDDPASSTDEIAEESLEIIERQVSVTPSVIDESFLESEIGKYNIKLKNNGTRKLSIYATVNNVNEEKGKISFSTVNSEERKTSAANWVEIKRGVIEILPGEEVSVPLNIKIAANAEPGKYYVSVSFPYGSNRKQAEDSMREKSFAELRLNLEIKENVIEKAQVKKFLSSKSLFLSDKIDFEIGIENFGNKAIDPHGFIYIYNRKGAEIGKIEIKKGEHKLGSEQASEIKKQWLNSFGSGKYKAKLEMEYGEKDKRDIQDTLFFWVLTPKLLFLFTFFSILLVFLSAFFIFKKTHHRE